MYPSTSFCTLRRWQIDDLTSLVKHANNRKVWLQLRNRLPHPYTEADGKAWIALATAEDPATNFAIVHEGEAVGGIGLVLQDDIETGTAEIGYWLGEAVWGRGIATEAVKQFVALAFEQFSLRKLFAGVIADNSASRRVLEKVGFQLEGIHRQHVIKDGVVKDQAFYGLLSEEWRADRR